jgi:hypothetical protein
MDDLHDGLEQESLEQESLEQEAIEEFLEEEFDPELFYRALTNALVQLKNFEGAEAAA